MALKQKSAVCGKCGPCLAEKEGVNHSFHLLMTICTCCFWSPVWTIAWGWNIFFKPYRCTSCGRHV